MTEDIMCPKVYLLRLLSDQNSVTVVIELGFHFFQKLMRVSGAYCSGISSTGSCNLSTLCQERPARLLELDRVDSHA